jgi:hypothetical protein
LTNLGSESETCVGSRVHLVGVTISFEKNFYRLPFTPPLSLVHRIGPSGLIAATDRRVVPLRERPFRIFEMTETANLVALERLRMLPSPLLREYAATRTRSAVDTGSLRSDRSLWDLEILPTGPLVSRILGSVLDLANTSGC